jgi:hypothetical protein
MTALSPNTVMRMQYLASEIGHQLRTENATTPTFTLIRDKDRGIHSSGVAAAASAIKTALAPVDPTIVSAT